MTPEALGLRLWAPGARGPGAHRRADQHDDDTEDIRIGQLAIRFLLEGAASGGSVAMFEFDVPANARVPIADSHDAYEETLYGLTGTLTWTVDGQVREVGPVNAIMDVMRRHGLTPAR